MSSLAETGPVTHEAAGPQRWLDVVVAYRWVAAAGALIVAITPAVLASREGALLRGSVSAYWNIDPSWHFWLPLGMGGVMLIIDGLLSYVSRNRAEYGLRWYNVVLGAAILLLTRFNVDDSPVLHSIGAYTFVVLFIVVIAYTVALSWWGVPVAVSDERDRSVEVVIGRVSAVFLALLLLTLGAWLVGLVSFFFFEVFALVNFALYFVQGSAYPFPYRRYEFPVAAVNTFLRAIRVMKPVSQPVIDLAGDAARASTR